MCVKESTNSKSKFCIIHPNRSLYTLNSINPTLGLRVDIK